MKNKEKIVEVLEVLQPNIHKLTIKIVTPEKHHLKKLTMKLIKLKKWKNTFNREYSAYTQPARDVPGTSPEAPRKVLTSGTSRGPSVDS